MQADNQKDCIRHLIVNQDLIPSCKLTSVTLTRDALEQLDELHYTLSFPKPTKIQLSCGQEQFKTLQGSYLASIPLNCFIKAPEFTVINTNNRIKGHVLKITNLTPLPDLHGPELPAVTLNSIDLESLHTINTKISLQSPVKLKRLHEESLYHTTIPLYSIICACALTAGLLTYRRLGHKICPDSENQGHVPREVADTPRRLLLSLRRAR